MKNIFPNSNFGFTKWCIALIAAGWMVGATTGWGQATLPLTASFSSVTTSGPGTMPTGFTQTGLAGYAGALKFDTQADSLTLNFSGNPGNLSFDLGSNNSFTTTTTIAATVVFDVQESSDGVSWTNLISYSNTTCGTKTITNIKSTSRYIRWIFTTKPSGTNIAVKNISLAVGVSATVPNAPTSVSIAPGNQSLVVSFTAPEDGGAAITNYKYSTDGINFIALSPAITTSPLTITGLVNGTSYNVQIKAVNSVGDSLASAVATGTPAVPAVPPVVTAATIPGTFGVALSANVVASQNPTSYAITSGTLPAGLSLNPSTGAITGTPTAAGTGVVVAVTASNASGTSAPANLTFDIAKGGQTITGLSTADSKYTTAPSYSLTATANSGLAVSYASSNTNVASISGSTVTIVGAGTTTITASQAGDNNYNAAPNVTQTLTVTLPPLVAWEMTGQSNGGSSPMAPTTVDNRLVVEGLTKGSGIGAVTTGNAWGGNDFMGTDLASAILNNDFATFSVTPASGYQVSFSQIPAYNIRRSSTGPLTGIWQYRKGSGAYTDIGSYISWGTVTSGNYNPQPAINLSAITDLQNVPAGTT
ncbi:MAG: hypothetical protein EBZ49_13805, partial [Proteobacteria bacterium]|nr:hypothetical protein [Pseudomonadota bacterium]